MTLKKLIKETRAWLRWWYWMIADFFAGRQIMPICSNCPNHYFPCRVCPTKCLARNRKLQRAADAAKRGKRSRAQSARKNLTKGQKMRVYKSTDNNGVSCVFDNENDMLEEVREWIKNAIPGDTITYVVQEMSREEFEKLPEFEGY